MLSTVTSICNMSQDMLTRALLLILISILLERCPVKSGENGERYQRVITGIFKDVYDVYTYIKRLVHKKKIMAICHISMNVYVL